MVTSVVTMKTGQIVCYKTGQIISSLQRGELLLPTSRVFDNLYPSGLPRSQPPIKEGNHGQVHVPHTPSPKNDPDALLGSPAVFFVRRRECGSAKIIE
jgi:hypothetical protein